MVGIRITGIVEREECLVLRYNDTADILGSMSTILPIIEAGITGA
jgi:hypothetical protein